MDINDNILYFLSTSNTVDIVLLNKANNTYPLHTHAEHYTMGIIIDGEIIIETDTDKYLCKPNEVFTIPIDVPHSIKPLNDCLYTMLSFCIHQDYLIHTDIENIKLIIYKRLNQLFTDKEAIDKYSELLSEGLLLLLANKLKNITGSYSKYIKNKLIKVPETAISIEDMSNEICVSSFHMIRQFKKEIGLTPHQFQIQCRIRKAQKMLLSNKTIAEVALDTGFCDQSHFVKSFKKIVGMTPALYQRVARLSKEQE
ncbi:MAG: helix-turn-helix transcriptional regulator [Acutalibacteraceae bacterium]|nr:helix-turn-helix transcriptional regulator [Acutalibacteraceae bacterium]